MIAPLGITRILLAQATICYVCKEPSLFSVCSECASRDEINYEAEELLWDYIDYEAEPQWRLLSNTCMQTGQQ